MKKIIIWASVLVFSLISFNFVNADHHGEMMNNNDHEMMETNSDFWIFTNMLRDDLTDLEKAELRLFVEEHKKFTEMVKWIVSKVKSWELNNYEEFEKIVEKRMSMIEKLKVFMKDSEAFKYMCMKNCNNLIAKLFSNDSLVNKYKSLLEKKYKSKIEISYSKKWKDLEKAINTLYHKNIELKNEKSISLLRAFELIIDDIKLSWEYWDVAKFIKKDLTDIQKEWLKDLLEERKTAQSKFKNMLFEAKENWNFEEVFEVVQNKRAGCKARFELYIDEIKKEEFDMHCKNLWEKLKSSFMK